MATLFHEPPAAAQAVQPRSEAHWSRPELHDDRAHHSSELNIVTILAHDLRNYLTPLYGRLGMIAKRAEVDQRDADELLAGRSLGALDQMLALVTNVLDITRDGHGIFDLALRPVDVSALVRQMAELHAFDDRPVVVSAPDALVVRADPNRLRQALHNLLSNALHYTPANTAVELRVVQELRPAGAVALITVRDHGPGISPELLPHLFQRFTPGPTSTGLGIGLCLARQIAASHGGTLTLQPAEGRGACFELVLPLGGP